MSEAIIKEIEKTATLIKTHYSSINTLKSKLDNLMEQLRYENM